MAVLSRSRSALVLLALSAAACGGGGARLATGSSSTTTSTTSVSPSAGPQLSPTEGGPSTPPTSAAPTTTTAPQTTTTAKAATTTVVSTTTTRATTTTRPPTTSTSPTTTTPTGTTAQGTSGGLTVSLTATPAHASPGATVTFTVKASESHAPGALAYQMAYGDGSSDQNNVPAYCTSGSGAPASQTWSLSHSYTKAGTYHAMVTVRANCTPDKVTVQVTITVS